ELIAEKCLRLVPEIRGFPEIHLHGFYGAARFPRPFDFLWQRRLDLRVEGYLMAFRLGQALLHVGTEQVIDKLPGAIRVRAALNDGGGVWEKQRPQTWILDAAVTVWKDNRHGTAGFHFGNSVVGVSDAEGVMALSDAFRHLLVSRHNGYVVSTQGPIVVLGFLRAKYFKKTRGLGCAGAELRLRHRDAAFPARQSQIEKTARAIRFLHQMRVYDQNAGPRRK